MFSSKQVYSDVSINNDEKAALIEAIAAAATMQKIVPASVSPYAIKALSDKIVLHNLDTLPTDVLVKITTMLELYSISRLSRVNKKLNAFFNFQLNSRNSYISKVSREIIEKRISTNVDKYRSTTVDLKNINDDLKVGIFPCLPLPAYRHGRMSISDYINGLGISSMLASCCCLLFVVTVILLNQMSRPDPNDKISPEKSKERIDYATLFGIYSAEFFMLVAFIACLSVACYQAMRIRQPRHTLFQLNKETEKFNEMLISMEEGGYKNIEGENLLLLTPPSTP